MTLTCLRALIADHKRITGKPPTRITLSPEDAHALRLAVVSVAPQLVPRQPTHVYGLAIDVSPSVTTPVLS